jgi:hypothetical protein
MHTYTRELAKCTWTYIWWLAGYLRKERLDQQLSDRWHRLGTRRRDEDALQQRPRVRRGGARAGSEAGGALPLVEQRLAEHRGGEHLVEHVTEAEHIGVQVETQDTWRWLRSGETHVEGLGTKDGELKLREKTIATGRDEDVARVHMRAGQPDRVQEGDRLQHLPPVECYARERQRS